ncbi:GAF domain-containing protein [Sphingomonas glacialis]|uniref:GAF domain-containing protein n=1 Tax=Sphingomonas glacialis TaxID=658225 RepID=A0A502FZ33_9SPHN|nr:GAF domain-containing protein [Sphingomonas glacialis]TPG54887.1 GAF domain-containing protein [Sphingomonas glacialis]
MGEDASRVERLREDPAVTAMLERICDISTMGFAAVARVTDSQWIACQVVDRIEFGLEAGDELALKTTICDEIRQSGHAVVIDTVSGDPAWRTHPTPMLYGFESYISFPIRLPDGAFFGTLCAIDPQARPIGTPAIAILFERFAAEIGALLA